MRFQCACVSMLNSQIDRYRLKLHNRYLATYNTRARCRRAAAATRTKLTAQLETRHSRSTLFACADVSQFNGLQQRQQRWTHVGPCARGLRAHTCEGMCLLVQD